MEAQLKEYKPGDPVRQVYHPKRRTYNNGSFVRYVDGKRYKNNPHCVVRFEGNKTDSFIPVNSIVKI